MVQRRRASNLGRAGGGIPGRFYVGEAAFEVSLAGLRSIPAWISQKADPETVIPMQEYVSECS